MQAGTEEKFHVWLIMQVHHGVLAMTYSASCRVSGMSILNLRCDAASIIRLGGHGTLRAGDPDWLAVALSEQEEVPPSEAYEHSEMLLYRALILEEGGQLQEALAYLEESKVPPPVQAPPLGMHAEVHAGVQIRLLLCHLRPAGQGAAACSGSPLLGMHASLHACNLTTNSVPICIQHNLHAGKWEAAACCWGSGCHHGPWNTFHACMK
jgi:hypothetical protein